MQRHCLRWAIDSQHTQRFYEQRPNFEGTVINYCKKLCQSKVFVQAGKSEFPKICRNNEKNRRSNNNFFWFISIYETRSAKKNFFSLSFWSSFTNVSKKKEIQTVIISCLQCVRRKLKAKKKKREFIMWRSEMINSRSFNLLSWSFDRKCIHM